MKFISFDNEDVQTLVKLGLKCSQAKIYLTLLSLGVANIREIARTAGVDRGETYRQIGILQEKNLLVKIIATPTQYKPIPLKDAIDLLIKLKNEENLEIQQKAEALSEKRFCSETEINSKFMFSIIPQKKYQINYVNRMINKTQKEMIWYTQIERIPLTLTYYSEAHKKAAVRGVRYRVIAELNKATDQRLKYIQNYVVEHPNFEIRFVDTNLLITFAIRDGVEMNFFTEVPRGLANSKSMYSDNPLLIKVVKDYFELRWATAMIEFPKKKISQG